MLRNTLNLQLLCSFILLFSHDATLQALELTSATWGSSGTTTIQNGTIGSLTFDWTNPDGMTGIGQAAIINGGWSTKSYDFYSTPSLTYVAPSTNDSVWSNFSIPSGGTSIVTVAQFGNFSTAVDNPYLLIDVVVGTSPNFNLAFTNGSGTTYATHFVAWDSFVSSTPSNVVNVNTAGLSSTKGFVVQILGTNITTIQMRAQSASTSSASGALWVSIAVPEPSTYVMIFGSVLVLGLTGFRKRKAGKFALKS